MRLDVRVSVVIAALVSCVACGSSGTTDVSTGHEPEVVWPFSDTVQEDVTLEDTGRQTKDENSQLDGQDATPADDLFPDQSDSGAFADIPGDIPEDAAQPEDAVWPQDVMPDIAAFCPPDYCPAEAQCKLGLNNIPFCLVAAAITEPFDDQLMMADSTTAAWGAGALTVSSDEIGGSGADGLFHPIENMVIDTTENGGVFEHTTYTIPAGITVTVMGPNPYLVRVQGDASIEGWLRSDGDPGLHASTTQTGPPAPPGGEPLAGGEGGAGAGDGGDGGAGWGEPGEAGSGPGGGMASGWGAFPNASGAGGGSHGAIGGDGVAKGNVAAGPAGLGYGDPTLAELQGGSGGGGGGGRDNGGNDGSCGGGCAANCWQGNCQGGIEALGDGILNHFDRPGGSGGGGGGAIAILCAGSVDLAGKITANGGNGGWGDWSGAGGGGSGGAVRVSALGEVYFDGGFIAAVGGKKGLVTNSNQSQDVVSGHGGGGIIRVESAEGLQGYMLNPQPVPSFGPLMVAPDGGTGADGAFEPVEDVILDTDGGPYHFTHVNIPGGVTVTAVGALPLEIHATDNINIQGSVLLSGEDGGIGYSACCGNPFPTAGPGAGGVPAPGGYAGGTGGSASDGHPGTGPGGAPGGPLGSFSSAGGAGHSIGGQNGGTNKCDEASGPEGGPGYGDETLAVLDGGSGGGGAGDALAAACTWCKDGSCIVSGNGNYDSCPTPPPACSYCPNVNGACTGVSGCQATDRWNAGSGGGGGGGALLLETPGMVLMDGAIELNGGDGGDNMGASEYDDGTCGDCDGACLEGVCYSGGGGSFGGSGGGGSGGALLVRAVGVRAGGSFKALGGVSGTLSQGGGCAVDPDAKNPVPGQGRGGAGAAGRIRVETEVPLGSIVIGEGIFSSTQTVAAHGTFAESLWYSLPSGNSIVTQFDVAGLEMWDSAEIQTAPSNTDGKVDLDSASSWQWDSAGLPAGDFVRFRVELAPPGEDGLSSVVESVTIGFEYEVDPL